jgi:prophage DNA circulation protein
MKETFIYSLRFGQGIGANSVDEKAVRQSLAGYSQTESTESPSEGSAHRDGSQLSPVVLTISTALGVIATLGVKKVVELLADDLYKSAKALVQSLFKADPEYKREIRIELRESGLLVRALVMSNDPAVIERALTTELHQLAAYAIEILDRKELPEDLISFKDVGDQESKIEKGDILLQETEWILLQYDVKLYQWRVESVLVNSKVFLRE